ncbi:MAG: VWA domain-containing protein [Candidatus Brocadia sp.]|nr:VWA domain-containing protein [Candidatus Brocadia sp.]
MDNEKSIINSTNTDSALTRFQQKNWVKKLEAASGKPVAPRRSGRIVYLLMDCSGSMAEGNKIVQAKKGAIGFAEEAQRKEYSVGLIQFASHAEHVLEPQNEFTNLNTNVERLSAQGSTNMAAAIQIARDKLLDKAGEKVICIVTDGMPDDKKATLEAANEARTQGIEIMAIGTDDADKEFLEELATRKELSLKVLRDQLERGIVSMAKILPKKTDSQSNS